MALDEKNMEYSVVSLLILKHLNSLLKTSWSLNEIYLINMILFTTETKYHTVRHNPCGCSWTKAVVTPCQSFDCQAVEVKGEGEGTAFHLAETKVPFVTMRQTHIVMDLECYLLCAETALKICCCWFFFHSTPLPAPTRVLLVPTHLGQCSVETLHIFKVTVDGLMEPQYYP